MPTLGTKRIKKCVLYGQLLILFTAFASLYPQIHGLFGERGLVPVAPMLECEEENLFECRLPLLRAVCNVVELSPAVGLQAFCIVGLFLSAFAIYEPSLQKFPTFVILYLCYRTIYEAGGVFMYYQSDAFLLESTIYVAILSWFEDGPADSIALFSIVVLLVRATFMNGATKLLSKCPAYWNLTELNYHFESQPLPTPLSWHAHHFPPVFKQVASLITHYVEIVLPPLFLIPVIHVRYFVFFSQVLLMTLTIFTGNNGFFNYNILVLLVSLLETPRVPIGASFLSAIIFSKLGYDILYRMPYHALYRNGSIYGYMLTIPHIGFRKFIVYYIDVLIIFMATMFSIVTGYTMLKGLAAPGRVRKSIHLLFVTVSVLFLNIYGTVPLLRLDEKVAQRSTHSPILMSYYKAVNSWSVANSYGSYKHMTGIYGRPEIVIEGATHMEGPWKEIEFRSKPVKLSKRPEFVAPHYPRLDMQMHLAAEGTYQQNPFFLSLIYHLMENTTEVVGLTENYPFQNRSEPMKFARAKLYMYHFTNMTETGWWKRDFQEEYMPTFNKGNEALFKYLVEHKIINRNKSKYTNGPLGIYLKRWHRLTKGLDAFSLLVSLALFIVVKAIHQWFYPDHFLPLEPEFND